MGGANEHVAYAARSAHGLEGARGEDSAGIGEEPNGRTMFVHRAVERPHDVGGGRPCQSLERSTTCGGGAVSIAAEIIAVREGRAGGHLSRSGLPITSRSPLSCTP